MMMRHIESGSLEDFAALYEPDVEMISVCRSASNHPLQAAAHALAAHSNFSERWSQSVDATDTPRQKLSGLLDTEHARAVGDEILSASDMLGCLLDCQEVGIRIGTITKPMCPRFHVDRVPCRLLLTLHGTGTEWIANEDVDFAVFADRSSELIPVKGGRASKTVATHDWALLKGGAWTEDFEGVVHRSPWDGSTRVLLSIDPIFS